jgi:hypothetical protein
MYVCMYVCTYICMHIGNVRCIYIYIYMRVEFESLSTDRKYTIFEARPPRVTYSLLNKNLKKTKEIHCSTHAVISDQRCKYPSQFTHLPSSAALREGQGSQCQPFSYSLLCLPYWLFWTINFQCSAKTVMRKCKSVCVKSQLFIELMWRHA